MEVVRRQQAGFMELMVEGRLDGYWAQHLSEKIDDVVREGTHCIRLNLSGVSYISSAGIRVLLQAHQQLAAVNGWVAVCDPSPQVRQVIEMAGLSTLLSAEPPPAAEAPARGPERRQDGGISYEIYDEDAGSLVCRVFGEPQKLAAAAFTSQDCRAVSIGPCGFGLGVGAFGDDFEGCRNRFGEFVAIAGAAACQPADGTNYPDYMIAADGFRTQLAALYGFECEGRFGRLIRFETTEGPVGLSRLVEACAPEREAWGAGRVAEAAGLMGAALKKSPAQDAAGFTFAHPEIRGWLSFSPQRSFARSAVMAAGIGARDPAPPVRPLLRPLRKNSEMQAHFHAAAFGYRPLKKGRIEMSSTVRTLFEGGGLCGVLHLLADDRDIAGGGESEFIRGAIWIAPITSLVRDGGAA